MNNFGKRAISGFLFVVILTACIYIHPFCFFALFFIINIIGLLEFSHMAEVIHIRVNRTMCILSGSLLFISGFIHNYFGYKEGYLFFFSATFFMGIWELYRKSTHAFQNICPRKYHTIFPYLFGSKFGKHKLFPRISPKKSWEGTIGGGLTTLVGGLLIAPHIEGLSYIDTTVISAIVIVFGSFGDLVESMFKRCIEIKDSGHIMPGHGGVLDRLDSILYALPVIFVYIAFKFGC